LKTPVSVLGTGRMGSALARAFIANGHPTTVWNRTSEKAQALGTQGASVAKTIPAAIAASELIIVNVSDYDASASLLRSPGVTEALRGKLIVELTSGTPQGARDAAVWAKAQAADYLDGAILATPNLIGSEHGVILVSGPLPVFDAHKDALLALGNVRHVGEDPGIASTLDSAALSQMWGGLFGTLQAIALCEAEDVDLATLALQWKETAPVIEGLASDLIARTKDRRFAGDEHTLSSIPAHYGALRHLIEITHMRGLDPALVDAYDAVFQRAIAAGHLHDDFAAMTRFMQGPA
jgi:3-hydroxyisobutyrate dehydrogenase-like beta-hydroxyacid dehydrogenase